MTTSGINPNPLIPWGKYPGLKVEKLGAECPHCGGRQYPRARFGEKVDCEFCQGVFLNPRHGE